LRAHFLPKPFSADAVAGFGSPWVATRAFLAGQVCHLFFARQAVDSAAWRSSLYTLLEGASRWTLLAVRFSRDEQAAVEAKSL